jgi:hypothetical protein
MEVLGKLLSPCYSKDILVHSLSVICTSFVTGMKATVRNLVVELNTLFAQYIEIAVRAVCLKAGRLWSTNALRVYTSRLESLRRKTLSLHKYAEGNFESARLLLT